MKTDAQDSERDMNYKTTWTLTEALCRPIKYRCFMNCDNSNMFTRTRMILTFSNVKLKNSFNLRKTQIFCLLTHHMYWPWRNAARKRERKHWRRRKTNKNQIWENTKLQNIMRWDAGPYYAVCLGLCVTLTAHANDAYVGHFTVIHVKMKRTTHISMDYTWKIQRQTDRSYKVRWRNRYLLV